MAGQDQDRMHDMDNETVRLVEMGRRQGHSDAVYGKRNWTRWKVAMPLEVTKDPSDPVSSWGVTMQNVSGGGVGFRSRRELQPGDTVYVREWLSGESDTWLSAKVTHCTVGILGFLVGVCFDEPAPRERDERDETPGQ